MSGAQQVTFMNQRSFVPPVPDIGAAYEGGFFAGQISTTADSVATHNLVVGPRSTTGFTGGRWKLTGTAISGTDSNINGPANTAAMAADGNSQIASSVNPLTVGGFSDWYIPAINELEVIYFNLKPTTFANSTAGTNGINPNAVPARASNYTTGNPAQTSVAAFQDTGAEAFPVTALWASTETSAAEAAAITFINGNKLSTDKTRTTNSVRAIRRVAV